MVVVDVGLLWVFLGSALVVLMQAQAIRLATTNRQLAASEAALRLRNTELDSVNSRLSEIDKLKNRFLAGVARELRRPLVTLVSESKLLLRHAYQGTDSVERIASAVVAEGEHLVRLIEELPERGDVDWQVVDASESKVDPSVAIRAAVATIATVAKCQGVEVQCQAPDDLSPVWANYERLVHTLVLLLDSAITYTPAGREVIAEVEGAGPEIVFHIRQPAGKGLSESKIRQIASLARRDGKSAHEEPLGGFTLALCREIIESHRGRFWIEAGNSTGTIFHIALPAIRYEPLSATYSPPQGALRSA
jgi:signal transduction histidine kinase